MYLIENKPASRFQDAHLLGNGRLGAAVYGGVPSEEILVNDDTLWSGDGSYCPPGSFYENLLKSRDMLLEGRLAEANDTVNNGMAGAWGESYLPLCSVHVLFGAGNDRRTRDFCHMFEENASGYSRKLDLENAFETVKYSLEETSYQRRYFVSYRDRMIYSHFRCDNGELSFSVSADSPLKHSVSTDGAAIVLHGIAPDRAEPNYSPVKPCLSYHEESSSDAIRFASVIRVAATDGNVTSDKERIYVNGASYAIVTVTAGTNYSGYGIERDPDWRKIAETLLTESSNAPSWEDAIIRHTTDYRALYGRFSLDLGEDRNSTIPTSERLKKNADGPHDPYISALAVQYSRYILISGSRPGTQALNLQGIWNQSVAPPWSSNYTTNINVEMCYWPAEQFNLSECCGPLFDLISECAESGRRTARDYYHTDGWVAHHNVDLWRKTTPAADDCRWFFWPMGGVWMCQHLWAHYEYTLDEGFLRSVAYPIMREACRFLIGFLCEDGGYLTTAPSTSPETAYWLYGNNTRNEIAVTKGSASDLNLIREIFGNTLRACTVLGEDDDGLIREIRKSLERIQPYRFSSDGRLLEWHDDFAESSPQIGCIPYLYGIYPGSLFFEDGFRDVLEGGIKAFKRKIENGSRLDEWPGAWKLCVAARLRDEDLCRKIVSQCTRGMAASLLTERYSQLESVMGYAAGIGEMLLQSHLGYIEFIPVPVWDSGSFTGMMARGGFECSATWKNGHLLSAFVKSTVGGPCRIRSDKDVPVHGAAKTEYDGENKLITFMTEPGKTYILLF